MNGNTNIDMAKRASKHHLEGVVDDGEFSLAILRILFNSPPLEWERILDYFTKTQCEIIRNHADNYFSHNDYAPRPDLPPAATDTEVEEATRLHKRQWMGLHHWIIQNST